MGIKHPTAPCSLYVATLPCETLMSAKQANNDKCSVTTYLRCGRVVNNQIRKGSLLSLSVDFLKSLNTWQSYKQKRGCLMHFARLANTLLIYQEIFQQ